MSEGDVFNRVKCFLSVTTVHVTADMSLSFNHVITNDDRITGN